MTKKIIVILLVLLFNLNAQGIKTPLETAEFKKLTSYKELSEFVNKLPGMSPLIKVDVIGKTKEGRNLYVIKYSQKEFGKDDDNLKVLLFAQQHGNEASGKEGALLLAAELLKSKYSYIFDKIDLAIVPQVNPDGSEKNQRRNGNDADLNRNHLLLNQPETAALHKLFNQYQFEVTMDVHEYWPFGEDWEKFGYRRNFDEQVGALTNINISKKIRAVQSESALPFIKEYISKNNFSSFEYLLGGPPEGDYVRRSTFDINDGRQSFGILNTFSFIQEGLNAPDSPVENIEHRAKGQMTGMLALIEYSVQNKEAIKDLIFDKRSEKLEEKELASVQMEHVKDGTKLEWPLYSYYSKKDSIITVENFRPVVQSLFDVLVPKGYLVPASMPELKTWLLAHDIPFKTYTNYDRDKIEQYFITGIDSVDFEGDIIASPVYEVREVKGEEITNGQYYAVYINNLQKDLIVSALEPKSMLSLATYKEFSKMVIKGSYYPILRIR